MTVNRFKLEVTHRKVSLSTTELWMSSSRVKDKEFILILNRCFVTLCSGLSDREIPRAVKAEAVHFGSGWDAQSRD